MIKKQQETTKQHTRQDDAETNAPHTSVAAKLIWVH